MPEWYANWVGHHRSAFLLPAEWADAAVAWWDTFAHLAATEAELWAASAALRADTPRFPGEHLPAVRAAVGRTRDRNRIARREQSADPTREGPGACADCGGSGWVTVPLPADVGPGGWGPGSHTAEGRPLYRTCGVTCRCDRGRATAESEAGRGRKPYSLDRYELAVARNWREMMRWRDGAERALHAGAERAWGLDRALKAIADRTRAPKS